MKITLHGYKIIHKSKTCFGKKNGEPLTEYYSIYEAENATKDCSQRMYAYECQKCGKYHLAPENSKINVKHNACSCMDSSHKPKALYETQADAEKQRKKSFEEHHIKLRIYECPEHKGFHLTHT